MLRELYESCARVTSRDELHAVLADVLARGAADLGSLASRPFLLGATRKRRAFEARTAIRRREREARSAVTVDEVVPWRFAPALLASLPPSLRTLAALISAELDAREIRSVLRLSATAFRKRLSDLGRAVRAARTAGAAIVTTPEAAYALGPARAGILANLRRYPSWVLASHDPDGHPIVFSQLVPHGSGPGGNCPPNKET